MQLNLSTIKPAVLTANEVATVDYVDTQKMEAIYAQNNNFQIGKYYA